MVPNDLLERELFYRKHRCSRASTSSKLPEVLMSELRESDHLVGGAYGDTDHVLRERELAGIDIVGEDQARHGMVGVEYGLFDQRLHGLEAVPAGDDGIAVSAVRIGLTDRNDEVFQRSEGGDRGFEFGIGQGIGRIDMAWRSMNTGNETFP